MKALFTEKVFYFGHLYQAGQEIEWEGGQLPSYLKPVEDGPATEVPAVAPKGRRKKEQE